MRRKAQLSSFVLFALVLLILIVFGIAFRQAIFDTISQTGLLKIGAVPEQVEGVKTLVDGCIETTAAEAIEKISLQGGYIDLPLDDISIGAANLFSNKLNVISSLEVAYWLYQKDNNIEVEAVPSITFMEEQAEEYIDANLYNCLNNFSDFVGYDIEPKTIASSVSINKDKVLVDVSYPIHVEFQDVVFDFKKFSKDIEWPLGRFYELAAKILSKEKKEFFLENITLDTISLNEEIPSSGINTECAPTIWSKSKVVDDMKKFIGRNLMFVKFSGTEYSLADDSHEYFVWDLGRSKYPDTHANLVYSPHWPFYIEVTPSEGEILRSQQISDETGEFSSILKAIYCVNTYNFVYNLKYPVLVTLRDDKTGYSFQFALQVIIERNQPRKATIIPESLNEIDTRYCDHRFAKSTIYTYENTADGDIVALDDVKVKYKCINHLCDIGPAKLRNEDSYVTGYFPICLNGYVTGEKEGYHKAKTLFSTVEGISSTSLILEPYIKKKVKVFVDRNDVNAVDGKPVKGEKVIIDLYNKDAEYSTIIIYPETKEINLIPGEYELEIYIITSDPAGITIPEQEVEHCVDVPKQGVLGIVGMTEQKCTSTTIPETVLKEIVTGRVKMEWEVIKEDLNSDYVEFNINANSIPTSLEELAALNQEDKDSKLPGFFDED